MNKTKTIIFVIFILLISSLTYAVDDIDLDLGDIPDLPGGLAEMGSTDESTDTSTDTDTSSITQDIPTDTQTTDPTPTIEITTDTQEETKTTQTETQEETTQEQTQETTQTEPELEQPKSSNILIITIIIILILLIIAGIIFYFMKIKNKKPHPITSYIKEHMKKGYSKDQIYQKFIQSGHKPEHIDHYFKNV